MFVKSILPNHSCCTGAVHTGNKLQQTQLNVCEAEAYSDAVKYFQSTIILQGQRPDTAKLFQKSFTDIFRISIQVIKPYELLY
jgi:hypothetical protein